MIFTGNHKTTQLALNFLSKALAFRGRLNKTPKITNGSGHYMPSPLQLVLAVSYFHEKGVVAEDFKVEGFGINQNFSLKDILSIADMIQFYN